MDIRRSSQNDVPSAQQSDRVSGSVATAGGLQFNINQNATTTGSGSRTSALSRLGGILANLKFAPQRFAAHARAQQGTLDQARDNGRRMGSLLLGLAMPAADVRTLDQTARTLEELGKLSQGDLDTLPGGRETLATHLAGLKLADLLALREGALDRKSAHHRALMGSISHNVCDEAFGLLEQMKKAVDLRLAQELVQAPLSRIIPILSDPQANVTALNEQLKALDAGVGMLGTYLQSLPKDSWTTLLRTLQPARLDAARRALSRLADESSSQACATLDHLRVSLGREIYSRTRPELEQLQKKLDRAVQREERLAVSKALHDLSILVDRTRQAYGSVPAEMAEDVRELVKGSESLFRNQSCNPSGPLNGDSFKCVNDPILKYLRQAASLGDYGLKLDMAAADAAALQRVETLSRKVIDGMRALVRMLTEASLDKPAFLRKLRDISGAEAERIRQLMDLGHSMFGSLSLDERRDMTGKVCLRALETLRGDGIDLMLHDTTQHTTLLRGLESEFFMLAAKMQSVAFQVDYKYGGIQIGEQLFTSYHLLNFIANVTDRRLRSQQEIESFASAQRGMLLPALRTQYGAAYDSATGIVTVLVTDSARMEMARGLKTLLSHKEPAVRRVTLPVKGVNKEFIVSEQLHVQGIEGSRISISVRGAGAYEQPLRFAWPDPVSPDDRRKAMGEALDMLGVLAGSQTGELMRLMDYAYVNSLVETGLQSMGAGSPFKLPDGTVLDLGSKGILAFDVVQTECGGFRIATTVRFSDLETVSGVRPNGTRVHVTMNSQLSWAEVRYALHMSSDAARQVDVVELPQFRHHFDV